MTKFSKDDLLFAPLGGTNEIGMNVNLYHYKGKWLLVDLGAGFADERFPGVSMMAPDIEFIKDNLDNFLGIVLTHAHEDHLGSVGYLWDQLDYCPIYATPFTASVAEHKLKQERHELNNQITIIEPGSEFSVGPFDIRFIQITHSVPEMNAVVINTEHGKIVHTGDWKFDDEPIVGAKTDYDALKNLANDNVLAMVCDSTNVFTDVHSGSESDIYDDMSNIIANQDGLVVVTAFASNVARMETIAKAAKKAGRRVAITGRSYIRMDQFARDAGYLADIGEFLTDGEIANHSRDKLVVLATGSQGQWNAAAAKIINGQHPTVKLRPGDAFIFSSKMIPGNEKAISALYNKLSIKDVKIFSDKHYKVHVSGHPSRGELKEMYDMVKPKIAIPVHGEPIHLKEHCRLAKEWGIENVLNIQNGEVIKLAPGDPSSVKFVQNGYYAVDGRLLHPENGDVMKTRRRMAKEGFIFVTVCINKKTKLVNSTPLISTPGVLDETLHEERIKSIHKDIRHGVKNLKDKKEEKIQAVIRSVVRKNIREETGKRPIIEIQLIAI